MGSLSTHVLDTMYGCPAAGMQVALYRLGEHGETLVRRFQLNADGRSDAPLLDESTFAAGRYRLVFEVAAYFRARGVELPEPPFLDTVPLDFGLAESASDQNAGGDHSKSHGKNHYHVPLLASPWAYSTYRGS